MWLKRSSIFSDLRNEISVRGSTNEIEESVIHNLPDLLRLISSGCSQTHDELKVTSLKLLATVIKVSWR